MIYYKAKKNRDSDKVIDVVQNDLDYVDSDGNIVVHAKRNFIMVRDENDLDLLTSYGVGSIAFTADGSSTWMKDASGEWQSEGGSGNTAVVGTAIVGTSVCG